MGKIHAEFAASIAEDIKRVLVQDPDAFLEKGKIIKHDKTTTVAKVTLDGQNYLIKRYNARNLLHRIKRALRQSRAEICWNASAEYKKSGLTVPEPLAMIERRLGVFCGDAYFVTEWLEGVELLEWLPKQHKELQESVSRIIKNIFRIFELNRLSHGDMKATNLLWVENDIAIVDLDSAKCHKIDLLWNRANRKDKRRFAKNGLVFASMLG